MTFLISEEKLEVQPEFEPPLEFYKRTFPIMNVVQIT